MRFSSQAMPFALLLAASPAFGTTPRPIVDPPADKAEAARGVSVFIVNEDGTAAAIDPPATLDSIARDGTPITLTLDTNADATGKRATTSIPAQGFAKLTYRLLTPDMPTAVAQAPSTTTTVASAAPAERTGPSERTIVSARGSSSGFLDRLYAYEPVYGVWGPGSTGAKLQVSFAARPIGGTGALSHLRVAYTQQIFWRVNDVSGPIRSSTYSPEIFFETPVSSTTLLAAGYRHDSNGGDVTNSVDSNRFYIKVNKTIDLGKDWQVNLTPQVWYNAFDHGIATDIDDYWGYAAITASIERRNGVKLSVFARGNPATGRGGSEVLLSYPIRRFGIGDTGLYLFGQLYTGYGEELIDYNKDNTRARIGISFTR